MNELQDLFQSSSQLTLDRGPRAMLLSLLLAFVLGQLIAWIYKRTHSGLSYSRSFTESLVLITMVVSLVMFIIGDSIVTAFGLIGALAIIRFRNVLKDTRDTVFIFLCLVLGMALGSQRYGPAILGTGVLLSTTVYLHWIRFGTSGLFDGHLSFRLEAGGSEEQPRAVLERYCRRFHSLSVRRGHGMSEYVFVVSLRDNTRGDDMIRDLEAIPRVGEVALVLQDELAEV